MKFQFEIDGKIKDIEIDKKAKGDINYEVVHNGVKKQFTVRKIWHRNFIIIDENNKVYDVFVEKSTGEERWLFFKGYSYKTKSIDKKRKGSGFEVEGKAVIKSPLPGVIKTVEKKEGDEITAGEGILFLEAMKMENEIKSPKTGILTKIYIKETDPVNAGDKLFTVE